MYKYKVDLREFIIIMKNKENHILHAYFMFILFILFLLVCFINISSKLDTMNQKLDKMLKEQIELSNYLCD